MVYRRRYRKRTNRKRSYRRRFSKRTRYSKRTGQKIYMFKRNVSLGVITISNISDTFGAYDFSLNDVPNSAEFTDLFDMYKINCVKITFIPQQTQSVSIGAVNNPDASARFYSAIDYNDSAAPSAITDIQEYQTCKVTPILRQHKRIIYKPKIALSNIVTMTPWLATSTPSVNYHGLKYAIEAMSSSTTTTMTYSVECKYYMSFKNVK